MKSFIKIFAFLVLGLTVAAVIYPFLHEVGHTMAARAVGVGYSEIHLFPTPYVLCDMTNAKTADYYIIGLAGVTLPFIFSQFLRPLGRRNIYILFCVFVIEGITVLACIISLFSIILFSFGNEFPNDDIINILVRTKSDPATVNNMFLFLTVNVIIIVEIMIKQKTIKSMLDFIE